MIAKAKTGRGFRGAVEYDLQEGKSVLLDTNLAGHAPEHGERIRGRASIAAQSGESRVPCFPVRGAR